MNNKNKISKTYDKVKAYLTRYPVYRDNDEQLIVRIWYDEAKSNGINPDTISGTAMLFMIKDRKVTPADTITRARRKVQEDCIELRGANYIKRKHKTQKEVINDIKNT